MLNNNYYKTLGLPIDSSLAHIKRAYKALAKKYHPDRKLYQYQQGAADDPSIDFPKIQ